MDPAFRRNSRFYTIIMSTKSYYDIDSADKYYGITDDFLDLNFSNTLECRVKCDFGSKNSCTNIVLCDLHYCYNCYLCERYIIKYAKYLLSSLCNDVVNIVVGYASETRAKNDKVIENIINIDPVNEDLINEEITIKYIERKINKRKLKRKGHKGKCVIL